MKTSSRAASSIVDACQRDDNTVRRLHPTVYAVLYHENRVPAGRSFRNFLGKIENALDQSSFLPAVYEVALC